MIWSVVLLLLTIQFQRFLYYFTVNMALLAAICIAGTFTVREEKICQYYKRVSSRIFSSQVQPADSAGDKNPVSPPRQNKKRDQRLSAANPGKISETLKDILVIIVIIFTAACVVISLSQDISYGQKTPEHTLSPDRIESLKWLGENSPDTGVDYYQGYEAGGFTYPAQAYGIMGSWDAGHWITVFSHRIPITNPFQDHLGGTDGAAAYFLSTNETVANGILQHSKGKYVIVDSNMAVDTFTSLVPWPSGSTEISPYIK